MHALSNTEFAFPGQRRLYHGKVRDVYYFDDLMITVVTDRISAFDHILSRAIPYKGQVLNQVATYFLEATSDIVPNWLSAVPDPNVAAGLICEPIKIEMVIRGYLSGHAWRTYRSGQRTLCGVRLPDGLRESDPFPEPIITPATKAEEGHDVDISREEIIARRIVSPETYEKLEHYTRHLFARGSRMALERDLILVDTKYEFGMRDGVIYLIDEIHTPDSSRYFYRDGYYERQRNGERQKQLSKEFVREWLMEHGFQGLEGQIMPEMPDAFVRDISNRYVTLYEQVTGQQFVAAKQEDLHGRIYNNVMKYLNSWPE